MCGGVDVSVFAWFTLAGWLALPGCLSARMSACHEHGRTGLRAIRVCSIMGVCMLVMPYSILHRI